MYVYVYIYMCVCVCIYIYIYIYKPHLLYPFLCWWIFRLFEVWESLVSVPALWRPTLSALRRLWIQAGFPSPKKFHHSVPYCLPSLLPALNWCSCFWVGSSGLGQASETWPSSRPVYPGKEKAPLPALWRENWLLHSVAISKLLLHRPRAWTRWN